MQKYASVYQFVQLIILHLKGHRHNLRSKIFFLSFMYKKSLHVHFEQNLNVRSQVSVEIQR